MGSSLLDPRRKRRRTRAHSAGFRQAGDRRCAVSLPWVAVLFGLGMVVVVGVRKGLKSSAKNVARAARTIDKSAHPLASLLEQHDIEPQAARFADPLGRCLTSSTGDDERLGMFTCLADTRLFLRAVGAALRFPLVTVVNVGNPPSHLGYEVVGGADIGLAFAGRDSGILRETGLQEARVKAGDPLPQSADLVLMETHGDVLPRDAWVDLINSWMQVLSESGVVVVCGPREKKGSGEKGVRGIDDTWYGNTPLWEAVATLACDGGHDVAAAVGDFDGGLIVIRRNGAGGKVLATGCGSQADRQVKGGSSGGGGAARAVAPSNPLGFEELFLWATEGQHGSTAKAIEAVQAKFGGADVVRRYARRRMDRSACLNTITDGMETAAPTEPLPLDGAGDGHLRARNRRGSPSHGGVVVSSSDAASRRFLDARVCLDRHLQEHPQDVRAGFALEMVLRAIGGNGVDMRVARLRAKVCEESGPWGDLLWRDLHARAAGAAAVGSLL